MANEQNLRKINTIEAREMQKLSAKKRSENKKQEKIFQKAIVKRAKRQDKSFEVLRDTMGQKPIERVETTEVPKIVDDI